MAVSGTLIAIAVSVAFLTVLGLLLAVLLILAEKKILHYGPCSISINNGEKELAVQGGSSLLSLLAENEIYIPSACGGRGTCAYCKVAVLEGGGAIGPVEEPFLTLEDRERHLRLSCQVKVRSDLIIEIPPELFAVKKFSGLLEAKTALTHDILQLRIRLLEPDAIDFAAGQYIQLESEPYRDKEAVMRAYSIASPPSDRQHIELIIRKVPNGICTTWVFDYLKEGQEVRFYGPFGEFHLTETSAPIIFIAGGSGMAPIWSILRDMREKGIRRETHYFFGALTREDLFFTDELREMAQKYSWFHFIPALSNEPGDSTENSDDTGERGLITDVVGRHFPDCSRHEAYLCGSPGMIDACIKVLTRGGLSKDRIFYDKFA